MKILIGCERSGRVRDQFIKKGHDAISCDVMPTETPGPHIQKPVEEIIKTFPSYDMIIAFPPCTHLACSGAKHFKKKIADGRQAEAISFFLLFAYADCERVAIENPVGIMSTHYKKPTQIIQPYFFGDSYKKTTCLWLKNLPLLKPTNIVDPGKIVIHGGKRLPEWYSNRKQKRDLTFPGVAEAMAEQWGSITAPTE